MKYFIYTFQEGKVPRDGSGALKTVRIHEILNNEPVFIGEYSDKFVSEFQLVMEAFEKFRCLEASAFERSPHHSCMINASAWTLKEKGIASVTRID